MGKYFEDNNEASLDAAGENTGVAPYAPRSGVGHSVVGCLGETAGRLT
jgi:hypothetical protein